MGTINAKLLSVELNTTWVNGTFSWGTSKSAIQPASAPRSLVFSFPAVCGEFPAARGVLFLTRPEKVWAYEVNQ